MQSITLSESVFRAHLRPSFCPRTFKPFSCNSSFSLTSQLPKRKSMNSRRSFSLVSSRYSNHPSQYADVDESSLANWQETSSTTARDYELGSSNDERCRTATKLMPFEDDSDDSDKSLPEIGSRSKTFITIPDRACYNLLKVVPLFGLLTFQGSSKAATASDFASGLQLSSYLGDIGDISTGFASAFLLIFFSELGDKTFFIAALLAARNSAAVVFIGTFGALAAMTIISVALGRTFHYVDGILPLSFGDADLPIDDIAAVCLLVYFGVSTLLEATSSDNLKAEEEQKEAELAVSGFSGNGSGIVAATNTAISTFLLVFVAEWGDKSFFSTIALAAASSPLGVIGGALAGHGVATLLAVLGGSFLGTFLSEKVIAYVGGALFLVFAAVTLVEIVS